MTPTPHTPVAPHTADEPRSRDVPLAPEAPHAPDAAGAPAPRTPRRRCDDRGEGVISAAIAVLIVASVGALMWIGFQQLWERTETRTNEQVEHIGT